VVYEEFSRGGPSGGRGQGGPSPGKNAVKENDSLVGDGREVPQGTEEQHPNTGGKTNLCKRTRTIWRDTIESGYSPDLDGILQGKRLRQGGRTSRGNVKGGGERGKGTSSRQRETYIFET